MRDEPHGAKIGNPKVPSVWLLEDAAHQHILWLDVAVNDVSLVGVFHPLKHAEENAHGDCWRQTTPKFPAYYLFERLAVTHQVHHQPNPAVVLDEFPRRQDVGMFQLLANDSLQVEPKSPPFVDMVLLVKDLYRYGTAVDLVGRRIDLTHAATGDEAFNRVWAEGRPGRQLFHGGILHRLSARYIRQFEANLDSVRHIFENNGSTEPAGH